LSYFTGKYNFRQGFGTGEGFVSDGRRSLRRVTFFHQQKKVTKERRLKPAVLRIPSRERKSGKYSLLSAARLHTQHLFVGA
jgi:hypothetical protein